jgi:hypothetical protein
VLVVVGLGAAVEVVGAGLELSLGGPVAAGSDEAGAGLGTRVRAARFLIAGAAWCWRPEGFVLTITGAVVSVVCRAAL